MILRRVAAAPKPGRLLRGAALLQDDGRAPVIGKQVEAIGHGEYQVEAMADPARARAVARLQGGAWQVGEVDALSLVLNPYLGPARLGLREDARAAAARMLYGVHRPFGGRRDEILQPLLRQPAEQCRLADPGTNRLERLAGNL